MKATLENAKRLLSLGESVQVVGLPGMGKSRVAKALGGAYLDLNKLPELSYKSCLKLLATSFDIKGNYDDPTELSLDLSKKFPKGISVIVLDPLNRILNEGCRPFFTYLKSLRDQNKYKLSFAFFVEGKLPISPAKQDILGDLYGIVSENIIYLSAITEANFEGELKEFIPNVGFTPNKKQVKEINELSGGIPSLMKATMQSMRNEENENINDNPRIVSILESISEVLGDNPDHVILQKHGLIDNKGVIRSVLLSNYLSKSSHRDLTASESRLLEVLLKNQGQLTSKEKICEAVYPDVKNYNGISDHAIDQLIHRLRSKVSNKYTIETHRGLGYKIIL